MAKRFVIISGGSIDDTFATKVINQQQFDVILAADSGMEFMYRSKISPDIIIGDFDSVSEEVLAYYQENASIEFHQLNPVKDDTDTEYAIRFAIDRGATAITILGGTGTRLDHVLGNISLLGIGLDKNVEITLMDANNRIRMINQPLTIVKEEQFGKYISLIPFGGNVKGLTLTGMKYPLDHYELGGFNSLGISNEIVAETGNITFAEGNLIVIESRD